MNENKTSCAPADNQLTSWDSIDWVKAELSVRKLQARIVKAQKESKLRFKIISFRIFIKKNIS